MKVTVKDTAGESSEPSAAPVESPVGTPEGNVGITQPTVSPVANLAETPAGGSTKPENTVQPTNPTANPQITGDAGLYDEYGTLKKSWNALIEDGDIEVYDSEISKCNTGLEGVLRIAGEVTSIGNYAFSSCSNLNTMKVSDENEYYDSREDCNAIIKTESDTLIAGCKNTVIPESVTEIGGYAFSGCSGLTSIKISDGVTEIGERVYSGSGLTSITISDSVTKIANEAFSYCDKLTSITIPKSVTYFGQLPFEGCSNLSNIIVADDNPVYDSRNHCNAIIETNTNTLIEGCKDTKLPDSVISIDNGAFMSCDSLTSIVIPDSVTNIGNDAFNGCTGLTSITIPDGVTSLEWQTFAGCTSLASITLPNSLTSIGEWAFSFSMRCRK